MCSLDPAKVPETALLCKALIFINASTNAFVVSYSMLTLEQFKAAGYLPTPEIHTIAKLALQLHKPILLEGPPGVGKTSMAKALATVCQTNLLRIQCYEGITAEQVIGEFNYQRQLLAIELFKASAPVFTGASAEKLSIEGSETLNSALTDIFSPEFFIARPLLQALQSSEPVVLLIDEIDRADEEFEALLLEALAENQITVPELGTVHANSFPIVVMTSNGTRQLSGALRRRSLYLALDFPTSKREAEIIKMHVPELEEGVATKITELLRKIRNNDAILQAPSISEAIELAKALTILGAKYLEMPLLEEILGLLVKNGADMTAVRLSLQP